MNLSACRDGLGTDDLPGGWLSLKIAHRVPAQPLDCQFRYSGKYRRDVVSPLASSTITIPLLGGFKFAANFSSPDRKPSLPSLGIHLDRIKTSGTDLDETGF